MRKRLLIVAGSLVAGCLVLLVALPFAIDVNRYRDTVQARLEAVLHRKVTLGSMALRRFPFAVEARDVIVGEDPAIATTTPFAIAKSVTVKPDWVALLFHLRFEPRSLVFEHPSIEALRKADGVWNFSTLGRSAGSGTSATPELEIRDGSVAFTDLRAGTPRADYSGLDLQLREVDSGNAYRLEASLRRPPARSDWQGVVSGSASIGIKEDILSAKGGLSFADSKVGAPAELSFDLTLNRTTELLHLASLQAKLGANSFEVTGDADFHQSPASLHLKAEHLKGPIRELTRFAAPFGLAPNPALVVTGNLDGNLTVDGAIDHPSLNGHVEIAKFEASSKAWKHPVRSPLVRLDFDPTSLRAAQMSVTCGSSELVATGVVTNYTTDQPQVDAQVKTSGASFEELLSIAAALGVAPPAGVSGSGTANVDLQASGALKNPNLTGLMSLDNATLSLASLAKPIAVTHLNMKFAGNSASIDHLAVNIGGANVGGSVSIKNFAAPEFIFDVNADKLDMAQFPASKKNDSSALEKISARGALSSGQLISNGVVLTNVKTLLVLNRGIATLNPLTAGMFGGTVTGSIEADLRSATPIYRTSLTMNQVDANALLSATTAVKQTLFGKLASRNALDFKGTETSLTKTLNGTLDLRLTGGRLMGVNILDEVAKAGRFLGFKGDGRAYTTINALSGALTIENGTAQASNLRLEADGATVTGDGTINLVNQGLGLRLVATLTKELLERAGGNGIGGLMVTALSNADGSVAVPVRVGGSFAQPRVTPDAERFAEMKFKMLEHPVDAVKGIFDRLTKRKPDAKQ
jgi:uncharacterized protein involved in outer membrane biogenesis